MLLDNFDVNFRLYEGHPPPMSSSSGKPLSMVLLSRWLFTAQTIVVLIPLHFQDGKMEPNEDELLDNEMELLEQVDIMPSSNNSASSKSYSYIETRLESIRVEYKLFKDAQDKKDAHLDLSIRNFEIYDFYRKSKWKKFLTFLKNVDGRPREDGSSMVQFEWHGMKEEGRPSGENRLKARFYFLSAAIHEWAIFYEQNY